MVPSGLATREPSSWDPQKRLHPSWPPAESSEVESVSVVPLSTCFPSSISATQMGPSVDMGPGAEVGTFRGGICMLPELPQARDKANRRTDRYAISTSFIGEWSPRRWSMRKRAA